MYFYYTISVIRNFVWETTDFHDLNYEMFTVGFFLTEPITPTLLPQQLSDCVLLALHSFPPIFLSVYFESSTTINSHQCGSIFLENM